MNDDILISIHPKWVKRILDGAKTFEVRKTAPKIDTPFRCYIYCTKYHDASDCLELHRHDTGKILPMNQMVVAEFTCDYIDCAGIPYPAHQHELDKKYTEQSCLTYWELHRYCYHDNAYFWHISDLVMYDEPKPLSDFGVKRPPQSWQYIKKNLEE